MAEVPYDGAVGWEDRAQPGIPGGRHQLAGAGEGTAEGRAPEEVLHWSPGPLGPGREGGGMTGAGAVRYYVASC